TGNWVDGWAPVWLRPYLRLARLDRPIGSWLLLMPCWWSVALAAVHAGMRVNFWHLFLFFVGAFAMRGAGCTWNDIVDRDLDAPAVLLYAGAICWVIGYDTIYAHQDRDDDALIGIKSTALLFRERTKPMLALFYALALTLIAVAGWTAGARLIFALGLVAFAAHLVWQIARLNV